MINYCTLESLLSVNARPLESSLKLGLFVQVTGRRQNKNVNMERFPVTDSFLQRRPTSERAINLMCKCLQKLDSPAD